MLDPREIAKTPEVIKASLTRRHASDEAFAAVDRIVELTSSRNGLVTERDELRSSRNTLSKAIGGLYKQGKREEAEAKKAEVAAGNARIAELEEQLNALEGEQRYLAMTLPNLLDDVVPEGQSDEDNPIVKTWGEPRVFDFEPNNHVDLGEALGILDMERGAKLSGSRFSVLKGMGARLERALMNFFLDLHTGEYGYTEMMVPYVVQKHVPEGTGQLPKFSEDMFKIEGTLNGSEAYLIPTAEVPLTNLHAGEILASDELPKKFVSFTPCFRSEAGSAGRDVRGLMRLHQFHKVELVQLTTAEGSEAAHEEMVRQAEHALELLNIPYRKVLLCGGDIGFGARKCFDLEAWVPSQGKYREISSLSNCGDFQARRMNLRYRPEQGDAKKKPKPVFAHTLNGSGLALGRTMLAILENYQQEDGSVLVPDALKPYMGVDVIRPQ